MPLSSWNCPSAPPPPSIIATRMTTFPITFGPSLSVFMVELQKLSHITLQRATCCIWPAANKWQPDERDLIRYIKFAGFHGHCYDDHYQWLARFWYGECNSRNHDSRCMYNATIHLFAGFFSFASNCIQLDAWKIVSDRDHQWSCNWLPMAI